MSFTQGQTLFQAQYGRTPTTLENSHLKTTVEKLYALACQSRGSEQERAFESLVGMTIFLESGLITSGKLDQIANDKIQKQLNMQSGLSVSKADFERMHSVNRTYQNEI